ncbi:hypothetical protein N0V83_001967 [Neocucurbitaria cava]|uniref:Uncharacterized protein n=1 Tax=Neocucurbitaria cava TaxID=798079 RepID=A0A9W9CQH0_9PLEO|nr:hypothetical protein N0V83_001967 [Neocucurbitaria cava]
MDIRGQAGHPEQQTTHGNHSPLSIQKKLRYVSEAQWELAKVRKQLLVKRQRVRTFSRNVQLKRVDAGDAEATFMSRLRAFINENRDKLPTILIDAYDKVEETRNDLGETEENYLQAERDLTGAEWTFIDQENDFYQYGLQDLLEGEPGVNPMPPQNDQHIHNNPPPPPPPPFPVSVGTFPSASMFSVPSFPPPPPPPPVAPGQNRLRSADLPSDGLVNRDYHTVVAELETLRKRFNGLRQEQKQRITEAEANNVTIDEYTLIKPESPSFTDDYMRILEGIARREVEVQRLRLGDEQELQALAAERRHSEPTHCFKTPPSTVSMKRSQTESGAPPISKELTTKTKVQKWLLQDLKHNAVQKALYLTTLESLGVSSAADGAWEDLATEYWSQDSSRDYGDDSNVEKTVTHDTSHEPDLEKATTEFPYATPSLKALLRLDISRDRDPSEACSSCKDSFQSDFDGPSCTPLPPSPEERTTIVRDDEPLVPYLVLTPSDATEQIPYGQLPSTDMPLQQQPNLQTTDVVTLPGRKDSGQSMGIPGIEVCHVGLVEGEQYDPSSSHNHNAPQTPMQNNPYQVTKGSKEAITIVTTGLGPSSSATMQSAIRVDHFKPPSENYHATRSQSPNLSPCESPRLHGISITVTPPSRSNSQHRVKGTRKRIRDLVARTHHGRSLSTSFLLGEHTISKFKEQYEERHLRD